MLNSGQNKTVPLILGFVFLVIGGWPMVIYFPELRERSPMVIPVMIFVTGCYIWLFIKWLIDPKKYAERQERIAEQMNESTVGIVLQTTTNSWNVDIQIFKLIFRNFSFVVPYIISVALISVVIIYPIKLGYIAYLLAYLYRAGVPTSLIFPIVFLIYSLICVPIYASSYVLLGYILRRKYMNIREGIGTMVSRYFRLSGFIILLSITWFIMLFTFGGGKKNNVISSSANFLLQGFFRIFKLFMYTNLVRVSLGDEKSSFRETYQFVKKDAYQMLRVWFGSGLLVSGIFVMGIMALAILNKMGAIVATEQVNNIVAIAFFGCLIFVFAFRAFAEQIGTFAVYLKDKLNIDLIK